MKFETFLLKLNVTTECHETALASPVNDIAPN